MKPNQPSTKSLAGPANFHTNPPAKKKRGCRSCCLLLILIPLLLMIGLITFAWFYFSEPTHPVEEEYESIPEYFSQVNTDYSEPILFVQEQDFVLTNGCLKESIRDG